MLEDAHDWRVLASPRVRNLPPPNVCGFASALEWPRRPVRSERQRVSTMWVASSVGTTSVTR
jgi:hypothetical protein